MQNPSAANRYRTLDIAAVPPLLASLGHIRERLGGRPADWRIREVGDGNLNLVFLVDGPSGSVCVKQALPYVRAADIIVAPDCGMKYLPREVAFGKLQAMVAGAQIVRSQLEREQADAAEPARIQPGRSSVSQPSTLANKSGAHASAHSKVR